MQCWGCHRKEGKITNKIYRLIRPPPQLLYAMDHSCSWLNLRRHDGSRRISGSMGGNQTIDRRSATCSAQQSFDEGCLRAVHELYDMTYPDYKFYCTCRTSRKVFGKRFAQSSVAYGSRTMRISFRESPPRTGRCRGLRTNSFTYYSRTEKRKRKQRKLIKIYMLEIYSLHLFLNQ